MLPPLRLGIAAVSCLSPDADKTAVAWDELVNIPYTDTVG
jgi:hypothetical protein